MTVLSRVGVTYDDGLLKITWPTHAVGLRVEGSVDVTSRSGLTATDPWSTP